MAYYFYPKLQQILRICHVLVTNRGLFLKSEETKIYTKMIIGVPKEIKNNENRIALTPAGAAELVKHGHEVYVQAGGGMGSGFQDEDYIGAGAKMLPTIEDVYGIAEIQAD
jgi:hypothetical protein